VRKLENDRNDVGYAGRSAEGEHVPILVLIFQVKVDELYKVSFLVSQQIVLMPINLFITLRRVGE
jgi:hypothetical protein